MITLCSSGGGTNSVHEGSLVTMRQGEGRGGLRFEAGAGAR